MKALASVPELESPQFRSFMGWLNAFAAQHGLRVHTHSSKAWEYPWIWKQVRDLFSSPIRVLDIGAELSPMPWFFASLGAEVHLVERDPSFVPTWEALRSAFGFAVEWTIVEGARLPFEGGSFNLVTSLSAIEHIPDKQLAVEELVRVLMPDGRLALSFDICERELGMTFPSQAGEALNMDSFDRLIWKRPDLRPLFPEAGWNVEAMPEFVHWHLRWSPDHNYAVGAAVLEKIRAGRLRTHVIDTGLWAGNIGDDAMFLGALGDLAEDFELTIEVHSLERGRAMAPAGVKLVRHDDLESVRQSIQTSELALLLTGTPIADQLGLHWPLRPNSQKLRWCHEAGVPVHAAGIGVDFLTTDEGQRLFRQHYLPVRSWSVRSPYCRQALIEMGVSPDRILVGADWAWKAGLQVDPTAAQRVLDWIPADRSRRMGVNVVNEIWAQRPDLKRQWAQTLDLLAERLGLEIFFFCNESRPGDYFDAAAARQTTVMMKQPARLLPNEYIHPQEMLYLISRMDLTLSMRYHFTVFSLLAGVPCLSVERGQKMKSLHAEIGLPYIGCMERLQPERVLEEAEKALADRASCLGPHLAVVKALKERAQNNLALVRFSLLSARSRRNRGVRYTEVP